MKKIFNDYLNDKINLETWQKIGIIMLVISIGGVFGWLYEYIFYYFNGGMKEFYWQGGNFLPWINIYAIGSILIILFTKKYKRNIFLVFIISALVTGLLEYFSGLLIFKLLNGTRYWDYNTEILNFGNIGGFVCLRSVLFFGISSLFLMYVIIPLCILLSIKLNKKTFLVLSTFLCALFLLDELYNLVICNIFNLPNAIKIYKSIGFNFMSINNLIK